jgi:signal transduction histidine kinase
VSRTWVRDLLRGPLTLRTWRELAYLLVRAVVGAVAFVLTVAGFGLGVGLLVTFVGLPVLALVLWSGRMWGAVFRRLSEALLRRPVEAPPRMVRGRGLFGWVRSCVRDGANWRGVGFVVATYPIVTVAAYGAVLAWGICAGTATYAAWWAIFDPTVLDSHGVRHHSGIQLGSLYFDSVPTALYLSAVGVVLLWLVPPWFTRGAAELDALLVRVFLRRTGRDARVAELERTRAVAVRESATTLRRVERDLHDGTQAQLVAVAMNISRARAKLASGETDQAQTLLDNAHDTAKDALTGLRDVVRTIHPPSLDRGLADALATLTSRNAIPTELQVSMQRRPTQGVETIAYFCVAELLTNVNRHAQARRAAVRVTQDGDLLVLRVRDDGVGGVRVLPPRDGADSGTGLAGLVERISTVDGRLAVESPPGGPTEVTVSLPCG